MPTLLPWLTLVLLPFVVTLFNWRRLQRQARLARANFDQSLAVCRQLLLLITQLQQHRGMSTAWLAGDAGFAGRLQAKQAEIDALLPGLLQAGRREAGYAAPCFTGNELSLFAFRWRSLVESLAGKKPDESIAEHSALIAEALDWLSALGEARLDPAAPSAEALGLARNYAHRLPALAECLGQARALGSGVAARHGCAPVPRVRLVFLVGRAETLLEQAAGASDGGRVTAQARAAVRDLAQTVRSRLLQGDGIDLPPQAYFAQASQAIDAVYAWAEQCGVQLHNEAGGRAGEEGPDWSCRLA